MGVDHGLITEFDPVIIRRVSGLLSNEQMAAQLRATTEHMRACAAEHRRTITIVDLAQADQAPAVQRQMQASWIAENEALLREVSLGTAFVVPSALVRGALTAIFWLKRPPHEHALFATFDEAVDWALVALRRAGLHAPERLCTAEGRAAARIKLGREGPAARAGRGSARPLHRG
jgi:hypothetical protein